MMRQPSCCFAAAALALVGMLERSAAGRLRKRLLLAGPGPASVEVGDDSLAVDAAAAVEPDSQHCCSSTTSAEVEDWTLNGPLSRRDQLRHRAARTARHLVRQRRRDDRQVPKFRSDMTAPEIAAMLESLFRVRGGTVDFRTTVAAAAAVPRRQRLPVRLSSISTATSCGGAGRAVGAVDRRPALPDPVRCRAVALLRRRAARFRGDRRLGAAAPLRLSRPARSASAGGCRCRAIAGDGHIDIGRRGGGSFGRGCAARLAGRRSAGRASAGSGGSFGEWVATAAWYASPCTNERLSHAASCSSRRACPAPILAIGRAPSSVRAGVAELVDALV